MRVNLTLLGLFLCTLVVRAQEAQPYHSVSDSLYWVIETNLNDRSFTIVRIYNRQNKKVYEVRLLGEYMDVRNSRHRQKLDIMLKEISERAAADPVRRKPKKTM